MLNLIKNGTGVSNLVDQGQIVVINMMIELLKVADDKIDIPNLYISETIHGHIVDIEYACSAPYSGSHISMFVGFENLAKFEALPWVRHIRFNHDNTEVSVHIEKDYKYEGTKKPLSTMVESTLVSYT